VLLDILDDVFLLYLALETPEGALDRLAFLQPDFGQSLTPAPERLSLGVSSIGLSALVPSVDEDVAGSTHKPASNTRK
jgi:hypothetical protein